MGEGIIGLMERSSVGLEKNFTRVVDRGGELMERLEGIIVGKSMEAFVMEIEKVTGGNYERQFLSDSSAAIAITSEASGSWRTRHLRVRAYNLRWRLIEESWSIDHVSGEMLADLDIKALMGKCSEDLRKLWKLESLVEKKEQKVENVGGEEKEKKATVLQGDPEEAAAMIKVVVLVSMISKAQAVKEKMEETVAEGSDDAREHLVDYPLQVGGDGVPPRIRAFWNRGVLWEDE